MAKHMFINRMNIHCIWRLLLCYFMFLYIYTLCAQWQQQTMANEQWCVDNGQRTADKGQCTLIRPMVRMCENVWTRNTLKSIVFKINAHNHKLCAVLNLIGFTGNWSINHCPEYFTISWSRALARSLNPWCLWKLLCYLYCAYTSNSFQQIRFIFIQRQRERDIQIQPICKDFPPLRPALPLWHFCFIYQGKTEAPNGGVEGRQEQKDSQWGNCWALGRIQAQKPRTRRWLFVSGLCTQMNTQTAGK